MSMDFRSLLLLVVLGCTAETQSGQSDQRHGDSAAQAQRKTTVDAASRVSPSSDSTTRSKVSVLFFGTSLTAGYGLDPSLAFSNLIQRKSDSTDTPITAINAGLSGETSAGAVRRIEWTLKRPVDIVMVETGGNDALRALDPDTLEANLTAIISRVREVQPKARILLAEMEAPPNLGARYTTRFRQAYRNVAKREKVGVIPFLLDGVAGKASLNQDDGVHPNEKGERIVASNVWKSLAPVVREVYRARSGG
jgi:acyl-CoA thioesterase-1